MSEPQAWQVIVANAVARELRRLAREDQARIREAIERITGWPPQGDLRKVTGHDAWRLRVGDFRILLQKDDQSRIVHVQHVRHRREAYRR